MTAALAVRVLLAGCFLAAALGKGRSGLAAFAAALRRYAVLPSGMERTAAFVILLWESAIGVLLLTPAYRAGAGLALGFTAGAAYFVSTALARGDRFSCGCLGRSPAISVSPWLLAADLVLLAAAAFVLMESPAARGTADTWGTPWGRLGVLAGVALVVGGSLQAARVRLFPGFVVGLEVGTPAPEAAVSTLSGETYELPDLARSGVVLFFVAEDCAACDQELRTLRRSPPPPVPLLVVGPADTPASRRLAERRELDLRSVTDGRTGAELRGLFRIPGTPAAVGLATGKVAGTAFPANHAAIRELTRRVRALRPPVAGGSTYGLPQQRRLSAEVEPILPLGEEWLDCVLVYRGGEVGRLPAGEERGTERALADHLARYPSAAGRTVWFDRVSGLCFSASQIRGGPCGKDYSFLAEPDHFLDSMWGRRYVIGSIGMNSEFPALPREEDPEFVLGHPTSFKGFRGKRILLVLGGPTTKRTRWERVETDVLWSCNKFYLNPVVGRTELGLVVLAPDVPLDPNDALEEYLEDHPTRVSFEVERGGPVGSWRPVNRFVERHPNRCGFFHLRYQSALGLGTRLLLYAVFLGADEIAFVGLDGITDKGPLHAFEPYKANPLWYDRFGPGLQRRQYVVFWEYVLQLRERLGFRILNLGESASVNLSSAISSRHFPLPAAMRAELCR